MGMTYNLHTHLPLPLPLCLFPSMASIPGLLLVVVWFQAFCTVSSAAGLCIFYCCTHGSLRRTVVDLGRISPSTSRPQSCCRPSPPHLYQQHMGCWLSWAATKTTAVSS